MSPSLRFVAGWLLAVALIASTDIAAEAAPRAKKTTPRADAATTALVAIERNSADPDSDLQNACRRSDFKFLALGLEGIRSRINQPKGEFETNAEFADRTSKLESILNPPRPMIVCQPLDDNEDAPFDYNADREVFKGRFTRSQNVWRDVKKLGSYVSHTAMGAKATVKASVELEYNVDLGESIGSFGSICNASSDRFSRSYGPFNYEVAVPRDAAPQVKARGYLVFVGRLIAPFIELEEASGSPTLDDPYDVYEHQLIVHFSPEKILVVGPGGQHLWECSLVANTAPGTAGASNP